MSRIHVGQVIAGDVVANARRAQEAEWQAMLRRPDAVPLPEAPELESRWAWLAAALRVPRLVRPRPGS